MSEIKSILVHVDANEGCARRLDVACELGRRYAAEVHALYAVTPSAFSLAWDGTGTAAALLAELDAQRQQQARAIFDRAQARHPSALRWQVSSDGMPVSATVQAALVHDLVVLGQRDPAQGWGGELPGDLVESVVVGSGRPVLVVPYTGKLDGFGSVAMIAWKPTRESARAIDAALPLLRAAREVHLVAWGDDAAASADAVVQHLQRHGVPAGLHASHVVPQEIGEALLSQAADLSANLLVMGCYGHSRAREFVVGGATRTLLQSMTLPVLMAH